MLVNIFTLSLVFFLIDSSKANSRNPLGLVHRWQNEGSNIRLNDTITKKREEIREENVWKQNVCQLTPCTLHSQSVDDDHWLDVYILNTCLITKNKTKQSTISIRFSFSTRINKLYSIKTENTIQWHRCYIYVRICIYSSRFIQSFIHQDRWCSVHWLVYLFKLMLCKTAVQWIQSHDDQNWLYTNVYSKHCLVYK